MKDIKTDAFVLPGETTEGSNLPPAGYKRDEELTKRHDDLQEAAELKAEENEVGAIPADHDAFNPERNREIQHAIHKHYLDIGTDSLQYKTKWVNYVNANAQKVWEAKTDGWQVATVREFPEAREMGAVREDNTIRVGDVILMFMPIEQHRILDEKQRQKRLRQQYGVEAEIHDLAERTNSRQGQAVFAGVSTPNIGVTGKISESTSQQPGVSSVARKVALNHLGNKMKQGTIPGVPIK